MTATLKRKRTRTVSPAAESQTDLLQAWRYLTEPLARHGWNIPDSTLQQWPAGALHEVNQFLQRLDHDGWDGVTYSDVPDGLQARPNEFGVMRPEMSVWILGSTDKRPSVEIRLALCPDNLWRHDVSVQTRLAGRSGSVTQDSQPTFADRNLAIRSACADALKFARGKAEEKQIKAAIERLLEALPPTQSQQRAAARASLPPGSATGRLTSVGRAVSAASDSPQRHGEHREEGELREIPLAAIKPSPLNRDYGRDSAQSVAELAESLQRHGQLQPIGVRVVGQTLTVGEQYELIWGEGRWRAAQQAGRETITARVYHCSEAEAIALRGDENIRRRELKTLERIEWYRQMIDVAGWKQKDLAAREGIKESTLSNQLRVLKLPEKWLNWISQEKYGLTVTHSRYLAPWVDRPQLLAAVERRLKAAYGDTCTVQQFEAEVMYCLRSVTRSVTDDRAETIQPQEGLKVIGYVICALTKQQLADPALDVQAIKGLGRRAWNIKLWDQYQYEAQSARDARAKKRSINKVGRAVPANRTSPGEQTPPDEAADDQREASRRLKLRRYVTLWQQDRIAERLMGTDLIWRQSSDGLRDPGSVVTARLLRLLLWFTGASDLRAIQRRNDLLDLLALQGLHSADGPEQLFAALLNLEGGCDGQHTVSHAARTLLARWISQPDATEGSHATLTPECVSLLAADMDIVLSRDWQCERAFLELLNVEQLQALAADSNIYVDGLRKSEAIESILARAADIRCPDMLLAVLP